MITEKQLLLLLWSIWWKGQKVWIQGVVIKPYLLEFKLWFCVILALPPNEPQWSSNCFPLTPGYSSHFNSWKTSVCSHLLSSGSKISLIQTSKSFSSSFSSTSLGSSPKRTVRSLLQFLAFSLQFFQICKVDLVLNLIYILYYISEYV